MSTTRVQKFLLIWKNHEGKARYCRLLTPADHSINASLGMANGKYLSNGGHTTDAEKMAVANIHAYVKDSGHAQWLNESQLSGFLGWDKIYVTGVSGI